MSLRSSSHRPSEAMLRATEHWKTPSLESESAGFAAAPSAYTITLSRETGARGSSVARELGKHLGWPVYDQELLNEIAREMGLRTSLLESVDERHLGWLQESLRQFSSVPTVNENAFVHRLIHTVLSLGAHGRCIIVGRGASFILPPASTLRVRLVASLDDRIAAIRQEMNLTQQEAARHVQVADEERRRFIRDHFQRDPTDPLYHDLILHSGRWTVAECVHLIAEAMKRLQGRTDKKLVAAESA